MRTVVLDIDGHQTHHDTEDDSSVRDVLRESVQYDEQIGEQFDSVRMWRAPDSFLASPDDPYPGLPRPRKPHDAHGEPLALDAPCPPFVELRVWGAVTVLMCYQEGTGTLTPLPPLWQIGHAGNADGSLEPELVSESRVSYPDIDALNSTIAVATGAPPPDYYIIFHDPFGCLSFAVFHQTNDTFPLSRL